VRNNLRIIIALLVVLALLAFMMAYTVRFTESAVVTTFGKANDNAVKREPGLYFKLPPPFQSVTKYDTRTHLLELKVETQQTKDDRQVSVETVCLWRVADPLKFFRMFSLAGDLPEEHIREAESALRANLRAVSSNVSLFTLDELFTTGSVGSKLPDLEKRMLASFREASDKQGSQLADYGIEAVSVNITRIMLPEEVSRAIFERMKAGRERIAKEIESEGQSQAQAIRDKAAADAQRISSFAEQLAQTIRGKGDEESKPFIEQMASHPEFAVFLSQTEALKKFNPKQSTIVIDADMPGFNMLSPDYMKNLRPGLLAPKAERSEDGAKEGRR
jgi:membrane protease subunit HflC